MMVLFFVFSNLLINVVVVLLIKMFSNVNNWEFLDKKTVFTVLLRLMCLYLHRAVGGICLCGG